MQNLKHCFNNEFFSDMFSRQTFDTLDDPTSSPPPGDGGEEEEIQPEMEEEDYRQQEEEPEVVRMGGKLLNLTNFSHQGWRAKKH